jgi:peptide/nickel transport system substrate-binding protein/oligopeptide transport system substrate-binding protein
MCLAAFSMIAQTASADSNPQGGTMTVSYQDDISTLDPAIGYDWQNPSMMQAIFDGLMDYKPGTFELMPDLAESFTISPDGTTYTFNLRHGVKFHNGRELTAADFKYSFERILNPKTQSPAQGYFSVIAGSDAVMAGTSDEASGLTTPDDYTLVIKLSQPKATFLNVLAMHFGSAVPKEEVEKWGDDFGHHPVGTGAFKLVERVSGQRLVFERNKDYFREGLPHLDKVVIQVGQDPSISFLKVKSGEVDLLGDGIPPSQFKAALDDPELKPLVIDGKQLQTSYLTLNVTMPPFDNVKVRQAINMAVNKERIVQLINNRGVAANQPLPPAMPGYDPNYAGYPYDPAKAKALLAEAGFPDGFSTELYAMNTDPNPRIAQAIQQDLAAIGIKVEIKAQASSTVIQAGGTPNGAAMIWSGGMGWIADFPDPSGFYWTILGCGGAVEGGWNWAWYCNKDIDARAAAADAMVDPAKAQERIDLWRGVFIDIMKDAPWVPVFNGDFYTMHTARIGGADNFFVSPTHIPIYYEQLYSTDGQ